VKKYVLQLSQRLKHMKRIPEIEFKLADNQATANLVAVLEEMAPGPVVDEEFYFEEEE
jgi:hypothetical protein